MLFVWHTAVSEERAASRPGAGQARSPQPLYGPIPLWCAGLDFV